VLAPSIDKKVSQISDEPLRTDETVAKQVGLGGKDTYRKGLVAAELTYT